MPKKQETRIGGLQLDPAVLARLNQSAATNKAALTARQRRDQKRISLRLDCPAWLKSEAERLAKDEEVSISHFSDFLLAWAMRQYRAGDPELNAAISANRFATRSLKARFGLDPDGFHPELDTPSSPDEGVEIDDNDSNSLYQQLFTSASVDA